LTEQRNGKIITFYSYKGGTGRSMLLANVAWILASHRKRVLMVDWDLEAPGLHRYFHPFIGDKYLAAAPGLVDWVLDYQTAVSALDVNTAEVPEDLLQRHADPTPYLISIDSSDLAKGTIGAFHLLPAGRQDASYPDRFSSLDFRGLYSGLGGFRFFELVKQKMRAEYDYVLIDSRTGVGDTSSICTLQMPDTLVVCFTLNSQSMTGASSIARAAFEDRRASAGKDPTGTQAELAILPVPTRIERSEKQKLEQARQHAYEAFEGFPTGLEGRDLERYWRSVEVPYEAYYAYEEVLAVFADQPGDITSVLASAERLTRYVAGPEFGELVRIPEELRKVALTRYSEVDQHTISAAERAELVFTGLSAEQEAPARELFLLFVTLSEEEAPYARPVAKSLSSKAGTAGVLDLFLAEGIMAESPQSGDGATIYELSDPALVNSWTRIAEWVKQDLPFRRWRREFSAAAGGWRVTQSDSLLLRGPRLRDATNWDQRFPGRLSAEESEFLSASALRSRRPLTEGFLAMLRRLARVPWYWRVAYALAVAICGLGVVIGVRWATATAAAQMAAQKKQQAAQTEQDAAKRASDAALHAFQQQIDTLRNEVEQQQAAAAKKAANANYIPPASYQLLAAAKQVYELETARYKAGTDSFSQVVVADDNLVSAGLAVSATQVARNAVYKSAIDDATQVVALTTNRFNSGVASKSDMVEAQRHLSDLQVRLAKEQKAASP
jgi:cellulose biosynthesis protein BcsQ